MGIQQFSLDPYSRPLTVHIVGASHNETMGARLTDYDELNHMFPGHQGMEVVMVGPEVVDGAIMRPPLRAFGPRSRVFLSAHKDLYHQFWEDVVETQEAARPDIVIGFHPGDLPFPTEKWSRPRSEVRCWDDWLSMQGPLSARLDPIVTGPNMEKVWSNASHPRPDDPDLSQSLWRIQSEFLSRVLTVGMGIQQFSLDPYSRPLTVHIVGASHNETMGARLTDYDELNHMFPGHQGMEVVMVGPEVVDGAIMRPPLRAFGPRSRVFLSAHKDLYHQFWEDVVETQEAARPDIVIGFHPGFHANQGLMDGWLPTLLLLRDYGIPTLFTVFSEQEQKASLQILLELEVNILDSDKNPFSSQKPEQAQSSPNVQPVYCSSHYIRLRGVLSQDPHQNQD
uniref:Mitochondrial splicing suppressor 51-like C-terminal domain-containing protein n=1 Tax=Knipowitschia caucasica TaxID=637954 RepID=A0AAV2LFT0_KNICA